MLNICCDIHKEEIFFFFLKKKQKKKDLMMWKYILIFGEGYVEIAIKCIIDIVNIQYTNGIFYYFCLRNKIFFVDTSEKNIGFSF